MEKILYNNKKMYFFLHQSQKTAHVKNLSRKIWPISKKVVNLQPIWHIVSKK